MQTLLALLILALPVAADPPAIVTREKLSAGPRKITLMNIPTGIAQPGAVPGPPPPVSLTKGQLYVVQATTKCEIVVFPKLALSYEEKKGPRDITANFPGGTGDFEDRTFTAPFLYILKATSTGSATVTIIPVEFKDRSEWEELSVNANNGSPAPDDSKKKKNIDDDKVVFTGKWRIVIIEETSQATQARGEFFNSNELWDFITSKCVKKPRIVDQNVTDGTGKVPSDLVDYLALAKGKDLPYLIVVGENGQGLYQGTIPRDIKPADFLAILKGIK